MKSLSIIAGSVLLAATASAQQVAKSATDYATLPPEPAAAEQSLSAAKVTLASAMAAAASAVHGTVLSARALTDDDTVTYEILCSTNGITKRVTVDGNSGAVTGATMTLESGLATAMKLHDGFVQSVEADFMATPPTVRVMIYLGGKGYAVTMNASTGDTISDTEIPWLPGVSFTGELQETPSGLKYVELLEGTGPTPPSPSTTVKVHYTGYLVDGTKFDSSVDRGQPADFPLDRVVKGWGEGVGSMKVGGKRKLIIPASLGYGERGGGPIPPNATLVFDVELVEIVAAPPKADPVGVAPTRPVSGVK